MMPDWNVTKRKRKTMTMTIKMMMYLFSVNCHALEVMIKIDSIPISAVV
jgi:hypothetical protein